MAPCSASWRSPCRSPSRHPPPRLPPRRRRCRPRRRVSGPACPYTITLGITQAVKVGIGRDRPDLALARSAAASTSTDSHLSFFSGHSSSSFCLAAFVHRDISDWLVTHPFRDSPPATRILVGRVL